MTARAKGRAIVTREGMVVAWVAPLQDSLTMLAFCNQRDPQWAPHRYANLVEARDLFADAMPRGDVG